MLKRHTDELRAAVKLLKRPGDARPFYFAVDGKRSVLHIAKKKHSSKQFSTLGGLNKHYRTYRTEEGYTAFSDKTSHIAGKVTLAEGGVLVFVAKIRKGLALTGLARGLKKNKRHLNTYAYQVSNQDVETGSSSKDAVAAELKKRQALKQRVARASLLSDRELAALKTELREAGKSGDRQLWRPMLSAVKGIQQERMLTALRQDQDRIGEMPREELRVMQKTVQRYLRSGGTDDVSTLRSQIDARRQYFRNQARLEKLFTDASETVRRIDARLASKAILMEGEVTAGTRPRLETILADLKEMKGELEKKRARAARLG